MTKLVNEIVADFKISSKVKYGRHLRKQELGVTLNFTYARKMLHIAIFSTDTKYFLICLDKFYIRCNPTYFISYNYRY